MSNAGSVQKNAQIAEIMGLMEKLDKDDFTQSISWQTGELGMGESTAVSSGWTGQAGTYKVKMFIWTGISEPVALAEVAIKDVVVN